MSSISGTIKTLTPANASVSSPPPAAVSANADVTLPGVGAGQNPKTYRLTLAIRVYDFSTCSISNTFASVSDYIEAFQPRTVALSSPSGYLGQGRYLLTATVTSELKNSNGTYQPPVVLDTKVHSVTVGNPTGCIPSISYCSAANDPVQGCTALAPHPGAQVSVPQVLVQCRVFYRVTGQTSCTSQFKFNFQMRISGPGYNNFLVLEQNLPQGSQAGVYEHDTHLLETLLLSPGAYTVTVSTTVQRVDTQPNPNCAQVMNLGSYSWQFTVI